MVSMEHKHNEFPGLRACLIMKNKTMQDVLSQSPIEETGDQIKNNGQGVHLSIRKSPINKVRYYRYPKNKWNTRMNMTTSFENRIFEYANRLMRFLHSLSPESIQLCHA